MEALSKWLERVESVVESETFQVNKTEIMEAQLQQFKVSFC